MNGNRNLTLLLGAEGKPKLFFTLKRRPASLEACTLRREQIPGLPGALTLAQERFCTCSALLLQAEQSCRRSLQAAGPFRVWASQGMLLVWPGACRACQGQRCPEGRRGCYAAEGTGLGGAFFGQWIIDLLAYARSHSPADTEGRD